MSILSMPLVHRHISSFLDHLKHKTALRAVRDGSDAAPKLGDVRSLIKVDEGHLVSVRLKIHELQLRLIPFQMGGELPCFCIC